MIVIIVIVIHAYVPAIVRYAALILVPNVRSAAGIIVSESARLQGVIILEGEMVAGQEIAVIQVMETQKNPQLKQVERPQPLKLLLQQRKPQKLL